jgi:hypothetical protein
MEIRRTSLDAHCLGLITAGYYATVVVRQNHHRLSVQVGTKNTLAAYVAIITVDDAVHTDYFSKVLIK